jgi:hypothetical protein
MKTVVCAAKAPSGCTAEELDEFEELVRAGGEVQANGLSGRVKGAHALGFLREGDLLIAVGGLKHPSQNHRGEVAHGAHTDIPAGEFPLELGWVFARPGHRGGKSLLICAALLQVADGQGLFATSRVNNAWMHVTLEKLGFLRVGAEWPSGQNPANLALFVKHAV